MQHEHDNMQDFKGTNGPLAVQKGDQGGLFAVNDEGDTVCRVSPALNEFCAPADAYLFATANQLLNATFHAIDALDCMHNPDEKNDEYNFYCSRCLMIDVVRAALNNPTWTPTGGEDEE